MHEPRPTRRSRPERLRKRDDFSKVMRNGRRARHRLLHLVDLNTGAPTRVGLSVGKQVGGAVTRNLVKRRLRMIIQDLPWQSGHDVVVVARSGIEQASFEEVRSALGENAAKMRLLDTVSA